MRKPERRRSSSQGDSTPRSSPLQGGTNNQDNSAGHVGADPHPSKRLGFLPEKLLPSASGSLASSRLPPSPLQVRSHSRADSALTVPRDSAASPAPSMASGQYKGHISPTKISSSRTYDSKLVSREMHRLGSLAHSHLPTLPPALTGASQNASSHTIAPSSTPNIATSSSNDPWKQLHVHVLPLFNGEPLRIPIEDLNQLVKRHIQATVSQSPAKALSMLEKDASDLISSGMVTLNAKLNDIEDEKLVGRVVELWGFFWDQVLPYVEGVLLPLQTDPLLSSLYRMPKGHKPNNSPISGTNSKGSMSSLLQSAPQIDVRTIALQSFRDRVILSAFPRMYARLNASMEDTIPESLISQQPRLQQMLLVLVSQRSHRPISFSLTASPPQVSPGEAAVQHLLHIVRAPLTQLERNMQRTNRAPPFLSAGKPRDRRGWIAQRPERQRSSVQNGQNGEEHVNDEGGETPRIQAQFVNFAHFSHLRERDKEFLESLRSPDPERVDGGWGLGAGAEEKKLEEEEEDDDETMDWDQAQAVVERMVGMNAAAGQSSVPSQEGWKRLGSPNSTSP
ncbi:HbrB-domain-containing protein [Laetiporus sulphureus 93-53]|uniref:HbrB-domain-containing protein n=1 Tax=Laetiporus sulphureus 93-53 TaxID=1314785 RepID=A0A165DDG0_9APHY|nr:HbrB-domain-containing protein [Laetiporus sulphureus 93-53]KZT04629.1 HbrB-domain-containing protein [Laetiporus sulphureus 93-53]